MSQLITVVTATDGAVTATAVPATLGDILSTAISTDKAVTGVYGLVQRGGLLVAGMAIQNKRLVNSFNPFA